MTDSSRLRELQPFIGTWKTTIVMVEGDKTTTHQATDTYRYALGENFIFHDVAGEMAGQRVETLEIVSVKGPRNFGLRSYDNHGAIDNYTAALEGREWRIDGDSLRFRGEFSDDWKVLEGQWDQKKDGDWLEWLHVTLRKEREVA